jgi:large subunit ribosomal protein L22
MAAKATARYLRFSPRKGRLVADLIKGRDVEQALNVLKFSAKHAARAVEKVVRSAVANAGQDATINVDRLFVREIRVDGGPTLKRFMTRSMGRANRILKRTCHVTVILDQRETK